MTHCNVTWQLAVAPPLTTTLEVNHHLILLKDAYRLEINAFTMTSSLLDALDGSLESSSSQQTLDRADRVMAARSTQVSGLPSTPGA